MAQPRQPGQLLIKQTCKRILNEGYQVFDFLAENNSNKALQISNDLLHTGATGTNVADVQILIVSH
jgi:hydroxypyruvate reductase